MVTQMDEVLWELSQFLRKKHLVEYPDVELSADDAVIALLRSLEIDGDVVQNIGPDGNVTWKATPKFLNRTGLETGALINLATKLN